MRINTPKINPDNPGDYLVEEILLIKQNDVDNPIDIKKYVTDITINEELKSPVVSAAFYIRVTSTDDSNLHKLDYSAGEHKIKLKIRKGYRLSSDGYYVNEVNLELVVTKYTEYKRTLKNSNVVTYRIEAVSSHAYGSALQRISRPVDDSLATMERILLQDLGLDPKRISLSCSPPSNRTMEAIINIQSPLSALNWIRSMLTSTNGTPYFLYTNIWSMVRGTGSNGETRVSKYESVYLRSLEDLLKGYDAPNIPTYKVRTHFAGLTDYELYRAHKERILDFTMSGAVDKLAQAKSGAFGKSVEISNYITRERPKKSLISIATTAVGKLFGISSIDKVLPGKKNTTDTEYIDKLKFILKNVSVPAKPSNVQSPTTSAQHNNIKRIDDDLTFNEAIQNRNFKVTLNGDFELKCGELIKIEIPNLETLQPDKELSGVYLILSANQIFMSGKHTTIIDIVKAPTPIKNP